MSITNNLYNDYTFQLQKIADIKYALAVLQWDQETYMPKKSAASRAKQMATLSELAHKESTSKALGNILQQLLEQQNLSTIQRKNVELSWQDLLKQQKYNGIFVRQMSEAVSMAFNAWMDARKQNDFTIFEPTLSKLVFLKKQEADILGYEEHVYNAHLNEYEKGMTVHLLDEIFNNLQQPLKELLQQALSLPTIHNEFLKLNYSKKSQWEWGMQLLKELGFDFDAGRQDISEHPFTTNFSNNDVRLTTRIDEHDFTNMTWSCIHELGHGLYEQGLLEDQYGLPCGEYTSLGIHESQSRLWENNVGRSKTFWHHYLPKLKNYFPNQLNCVDVDHFYKAINKIEPSFIRTEADELTYHSHVKIRYNIEKEIFSNNCTIKDIPSIWNEQYNQLLGVIVSNDNEGCLQDVHWSHGSFGYFPTYSLGSFYAAQFYATIQKELPNINVEIANGETKNLLNWLRNKVHKHGRMYTSNELCELITGEKLNTNYFIEYISNKIKTLQ